MTTFDEQLLGGEMTLPEKLKALRELCEKYDEESDTDSAFDIAPQCTTLLAMVEAAVLSLEKIGGWPGPEGTNVTHLNTSEANMLRRDLARETLTRLSSLAASCDEGTGRGSV